MRKKRKSKLCNACFRGAVDYGEILEGVVLAEFEGQVRLFHSLSGYGDVLFTFPKTPVLPPIQKIVGETDKEYDKRINGLPVKVIKRDLAWLHRAERQMRGLHISLNHVYEWAQKLQKAGYNPAKHGMGELWLYERAATMLATPNTVVVE